MKRRGFLKLLTGAVLVVPVVGAPKWVPKLTGCDQLEIAIMKALIKHENMLIGFMHPEQLESYIQTVQAHEKGVKF